MDKYTITVPKLKMLACSGNGKVLYFDTMEGATEYKDRLQVEIFKHTGKTYKMVINKTEIYKKIFIPKLH